MAVWVALLALARQQLQSAESVSLAILQNALHLSSTAGKYRLTFAGFDYTSNISNQKSEIHAHNHR